MTVSSGKITQKHHLLQIPSSVDIMKYAPVTSLQKHRKVSSGQSRTFIVQMLAILNTSFSRLKYVAGRVRVHEA